MSEGKSKSDVVTPKAATVIWRYMDIPSFVSLLQTQELIFRRVDKFPDQHEAVVSRPTLERIVDELHERARTEFRGGPGTRMFSDEELRRMAMDFQRQYMDSVRKRNFVNCWHANANESVAMWDLYSKRGVAIRSKAGYLGHAHNLPKMLVGQVNYVDHLSDEVNDLMPFLFKRMEYQHEREIRAFIPQQREIRVDESGQELLYVPVKYDLHTLIDEVRVAPGTSSWLFSTVQQLLQTYGLPEVPCNRAEADQLPDFMAELEQRLQSSEDGGSSTPARI